MGKSKSGDETVVISFKLGHDLYKQLEKATAGQVDSESGIQLTPHQMARRLMLLALRKVSK